MIVRVLGAVFLNYRILIVDDDPSIHEVIECALIEDLNMTDIKMENVKNELFDLKESEEDDNSINYILESAFQGEEALEKLDEASKNGTPYSLAIVDSRMPPGIDGATTIERIFNKYDNIDVIFSTAYSDVPWQDVRKKVKYKGNFVFIKKPFDIYIFRQFVFLFAYKRKFLKEFGGKINHI